MQVIILWHVMGRDMRTVRASFDAAKDLLEMLCNNCIQFTVEYAFN